MLSDRHVLFTAFDSLLVRASHTDCMYVLTYTCLLRSSESVSSHSKLSSRLSMDASQINSFHSISFPPKPLKYISSFYHQHALQPKSFQLSASFKLELPWADCTLPSDLQWSANCMVGPCIFKRPTWDISGRNKDRNAVVIVWNYQELTLERQLSKSWSIWGKSPIYHRESARMSWGHKPARTLGWRCHLRSVPLSNLTEREVEYIYLAPTWIARRARVTAPMVNFMMMQSDDPFNWECFWKAREWF